MSGMPLPLTWGGPQLGLLTQLMEDTQVELLTSSIKELPAGTTLVVPVQSRPRFLTERDSMLAIRQHVSRGGLVILVDAQVGGGDATRHMVASTLGYTGRSSLTAKGLPCRLLMLPARLRPHQK